MKYLSIIAVNLSVLLALAACERSAVDSPAMDEAAGDYERGPHNGRMLRDDGFAVELAIYETGVPPEFRAWVTAGGEPVPPGAVDLEVRLTRLGNVVDEIGFRPQGDFLRGDTVVYEPHSFAVTVAAEHAGRPHEWRYESFEGRTRIDAETAAALGLETEIAGPAVLEETITLYGEIAPNAGRVREVSARFDGAIRSVDAALGDTVRAGQTLAQIESNESLRVYTIEAPIAGVITERNANPGEQTAGRRLFTIVDTSSVWANLAVPLADRARVRAGAPAEVQATLGDAAAASTIAQLDVRAGERQAVTARVVLDNADDAWALGTYVSAAVEVAEVEVPLAVKRSGLQPFRDFTVVYAQIGDEYEVRMLDLGREAGEWVEVLGGLAPGTRYVTEGSYVLKADVEKSGAAHDH